MKTLTKNFNFQLRTFVLTAEESLLKKKTHTVLYGMFSSLFCFHFCGLVIKVIFRKFYV